MSKMALWFILSKALLTSRPGGVRAGESGGVRGSLGRWESIFVNRTEKSAGFGQDRLLKKDLVTVRVSCLLFSATARPEGWADLKESASVAQSAKNEPCRRASLFFHLHSCQSNQD